MQTRILLSHFLLGALACSTTSSTSKQSSSFAEPSGLSCETRVPVPGISAEYAWVRRHYPGAQVKMQALGNCAGAPADELYITTANGRQIILYFDISSFFGKGF